MSGGAPLPEGLVKRFEERTGHYIGQGYGLTETAAQAVTVPHSLRAPVDPESGNLSTGLPQADAMVRILDDDGNPDGPREVGEVAIGRPMVADEYLGNPQATADSIPGGELRTGDVGFMDQDGWVFIVDDREGHDQRVRLQGVAPRGSKTYCTCTRRSARARSWVCRTSTAVRRSSHS